MFIERCCASLGLLACVVVAAGCFNPEVKNMGFTCVATDDPPCPQGYFCVNGFCVDNPAQVVTDDMTATVDMSFPVNDFASTDLAKGNDLASSMPDLATGGSCGMSGDQCITQTCCPGSVCFLISCI